MQPAKIGIMGQPPVVGIEAIDNEDLALAEWCGKMAGKYENQSRKFLKIAERLREIDHIRPYVRHHTACKFNNYGPECPCTCGLDRE